MLRSSLQKEKNDYFYKDYICILPFGFHRKNIPLYYIKNDSSKKETLINTAMNLVGDKINHMKS